MKKLSIILILSLLFLVGCNRKNDKFMSEYLNIKDKNHVFREVTFNELKDSFNSGTHIIYFGWPECPWCQQYVYYYNLQAKENDIDEIIYYNHNSIRNYQIKNNDVIINNQFLELVELLKEENVNNKKVVTILDENGNEIKDIDNISDDNIETIPWIYAPSIYLIKNGEVVGVPLSTLPSHLAVNGSVPLLNVSQQEELKSNLNELFSLYN